jgi:CheY-like chemotaxis protein
LLAARNAYNLLELRFKEELGMTRKVILAVNNMIFTSKIMSVLDTLEAEGIKAIRSEDIFSKAQEIQPDLIIMDLNLNGIEAPSLINKLRSYKNTKQIPIVCYSPHVMADQMQAAVKAGATEVLTNTTMTSRMSRILGKYIHN